MSVDLVGGYFESVVNQVSSMSRYGCRVSVALSAFLCVHAIVMSSAEEEICISGACGKSIAYRAKRF